MSHVLGEDFVFISSIQGVAIIVIMIMDRSKCIEAVVLTQLIFLGFGFFSALVFANVNCVL